MSVIFSSQLNCC